MTTTGLCLRLKQPTYQKIQWLRTRKKFTSAEMLFLVCGLLKETLIYSALPIRVRVPRRKSSNKCLIYGARRGRVPRRGELKNSTGGFFQHRLRHTKKLLPLLLDFLYIEKPVFKRWCR